MRRVVVGLVQINSSFGNQSYLPLSVGMLQAYAQHHLPSPERYEFLLPIHTRMPVAQAVARLAAADVVLFSVYVWNFRLSLEVARALKQLRPDTRIVFGGPHVPERAEQNEAFLRAHPFIDVACIGPGEEVAAAVLERAPDRAWGAVPSLSFLDADGRHVMTARAPRLEDLTALPSPYLEGVFAPLMAAHPETQWIGLWETNRGCPFSCTFCDWGSATQSRVFRFDLERLLREMDWFAARRIEFIFCCDANFGILPRDLDIVRYAAETKRLLGYPRALSVQKTKNATERAYQVQKILSDAGMNKGTDIAIQSYDPRTLENIKRANISTATYQDLQRRFTRDGVETYTDLILALPGETYESYVEGASSCIEGGQHNRIQFLNLAILPNAEMGDPAYQARYGMELVENSVVNIHGSREEADWDVPETQLLVVATAAMPGPDWVRARAFAWMTALLHFDKVLQIPFVVLHEVGGVRYRELVEVFLHAPAGDLPVVADLRAFFLAKAAEIQRGGPELAHSTEWLPVWWPPDEYALIELCFRGQIAAFYDEAERLLGRFLDEKSLVLPPGALRAAMTLNRALLKQPFQTDDLSLELPYDIWSCYVGALRGEPVLLEERPTRHFIDRTSQRWATWDDWCREVIWYGSKRGAYLYGAPVQGAELAGHY